MAERMGINEKINKIFFLPPSFHAFLAGSLLGVAMSLILGLLSSKKLVISSAEIAFLIEEQPTNPILLSLAIFFSLCSAILLIYVSIKLELMREEVSGLPERKTHLEDEIKAHSIMLRSSFFTSVLFGGLSFLSMYLASW